MERNYHVTTHEGMDALMRYLAASGYKWSPTGEVPSDVVDYDYEIICAEDEDHTLTWTDSDSFEKYSQDKALIEVSTSNEKLFLSGPDGTWAVAGDNLIHKTIDEIRPDYYQHEGRDLFDHFSEMFTTQEFRGFMVGNVIKYVIRYHSKNGEEDLRKARTYLNWLIQAEESGR